METKKRRKALHKIQNSEADGAESADLIVFDVDAAAGRLAVSGLCDPAVESLESP